MRFSRARYVTLCQQSLVTASVLAVGLSAAGVKTLDIVPQPGAAAGVREGAAGAAPGAGSTQQTFAAGPSTVEKSPGKSQVDTAPVTPKVREVAVTSPPASAAAPRVRPTTPAEQPSARSKVQPTPQPRTSAPSRPGFVESAPQAVQGYATVGVTWQHGVNYSDNQISVQIRTEKNGAWSKWMVDHFDAEEAPSAGPEGNAASVRPGTDPLVIGDVDRVQMRAQTTTGTVPPDLRLAIVDPGTGKMTTQAPAIDTAKLPSAKAADATGAGASPQASGTTTLSGDGVQDDVTLSAMTRAPKPYIYSRAQWGANEKMRDQSPPSYGTVQTGFIHHTVNANNYTPAQVPALLRGIYAYHTQSRGWRDIGYNYLVDRFGRIWEGRWGGVDRAVVGAHTLGYNEVSFAMSAIGNFDIAKPPAAVVAAYARLFAWKLSIYNIAANNPRILVKGRYLHAINGHRDVGQTACPGRYLYAWIPYIRTRARQIQLDAQKGGGSTPAPPPPPPAPSTTFTSPTQQPRPATVQPAITFPRATNITGTSYPDLVLKARATGALRVLPTGGQTGFGTPVTTRGSWGAMNLLAATGDLTGDGKGDVIARASRTGLTRIYRGDGAGHVTTSGINATTRFRSANLVASAGDWTGDGKNDVLMRTRSGSLYVIPGTGTGTFSTPRRLGTAWSGFSAIQVAGDLTGDGHKDVVALKAGGVYVAPGIAGGGLGAPVLRVTISSQWDELAGGAADVTGDGIGDVVVRSKVTGLLKILTGAGNGTFGPTLGPFRGGGGVFRLTGGQMAGTTVPDVVGTNASGSQLVVVPSNGLVNISGSLPAHTRVPGATQLLNVGDWNRDGKTDLVTREASGDTLKLRPGLGDGRFGGPVLMSNGWSTFTNLSAVGDVTGDSFPDLVGKTATGAMEVFPGNGKTGFFSPILAPASLRSFNQVASASPWTTAGLPGSAFLSSDGSFVPYGGTSGAGDLAGYDWVIGPGDVDGDGVADLVARDTSGTLWLLPGTTRGYLERRFLAAGYAGYSLGG